MKEQSRRIDDGNPGHRDVVRIQDIAKGLECGNPACGCHHEGPNGWQTHCPAHGDENPSLSLSEGDGGKILAYCHAGCDQTEVIQALMDRDLWASQGSAPGTSPTRSLRGELEVAYSYVDETGKLLFQACRYEPKVFRQRKPAGQGDWEYTIKDVRLVPYNLPDVLQAPRVFIAEGEKDCINLKKVGLTASCNPMGAGKWRKEFNYYFKDKEVIILPDNDDPGRKHAASVARHLRGIAASVKILELSGAAGKRRCLRLAGGRWHCRGVTGPG
jgi:putative DNA primase/helicase